MVWHPCILIDFNQIVQKSNLFCHILVMKIEILDSYICLYNYVNAKI